ncbi:MAG: phosphatase PAP2 family protein [Micromonosporaceae bacterium]
MRLPAVSVSALDQAKAPVHYLPGQVQDLEVVLQDEGGAGREDDPVQLKGEPVGVFTRGSQEVTAVFRPRAAMRSGVDAIHLRPGRPLLTASARPWAGALLAFCAILVAVLGVLFTHQAKAGWLDHAVDSPIITWFGGHPGLAVRLAAPGSPIPAGVLTAAIVVACLLTGRLNGAVLAAAAVPAAVGLNEGLLKPLVHRTYLGNVVFPSGHTTAMFALAATVTVLLLIPPQQGKPGALRVLIPAAACVLGGVVAIAVIGLRWHYFTDTVAGAAAGIGTVCGLALILDLPAARRWLARASRRLPEAQEPRSHAAREHQTSI